VYAAFPEIAPTAAARQELETVLPRLSDADPRERDRAFHDLQQLGPDVTCATAHWPEDELDPQQLQLLRQYLRSQSRRRDVPPAELRREPMFLVDCLDYDDVRVRAVAKAELERVLSRTIDVDTTRADACTTTAAKLREELLAKRG
jgi:hypothetical protein